MPEALRLDYTLDPLDERYPDAHRMTTTLRKENKAFEPGSWESVPCPFCGSDDAFLLERYGTEHRFTYVRCRNCHLAYQNPRPTYDQDFIDVAYSEYVTSIDHLWDGTRPTEEGARLLARMGHIVEEIEARLPPGNGGETILEIGCHVGGFLKAAGDRGWTATGVDVSEAMVELARNELGLDARAGDWTQMSFDRPFDVIYCAHVIEHIPDPARWLQCFKDNLAPHGLLVLEVPNMDSLDRLYKRLAKRLHLRRDRWAVWRTPDHLYEPCRRSLLPFLERNGFRVTDHHTYSRKERRGAWADFYYRYLGAGSNLRVFAVLEQGHPARSKETPPKNVNA